MKQDEALALMEAGHSVLLTGAAGTGKTFILSEFIRRSKRRGKYVAVTATTGLAATHLNGTTIHAWSGIGVHDDIDSKQIGKFSKQRTELIRKADILVIDEISMLHDFRLDLVDKVARVIRETDAPFGGIQVILCGDFFQLPPVNRSDSRQGGFIITSNVWQEGNFTVCYLQEQYRQADDTTYADVLNGIRAGVLTRGQLNALQKRGEAVQDPWSTHTRLLTTNVDVDSINLQHLNALDGEERTYEMSTSGGKQYIEQILRSCLASPLLRLKVGAQVMCIKNSQDRRYANGSLGTVIGFDDDTGYPIVRLVNGRTATILPDSWELMDGEKRRAQINQLPLRLAWAITVHKSQGMTLDAARIDLSNAFVEGMGYVALSRVRSMKHLILDGLNGMALRVSPMAREIDAELRARSNQAKTANENIIQEWLHQEEERGGADIAVPEPDMILLEKLKTWRTETARKDKVAPFIVAHNTLLEAIAAAKPKDLAELRRVKGMGDKKLAQYGNEILNTLDQEAGVKK